jgi:transketolase
MSLDQLCVNTIRMLSVDGVQAANSGHPGLPMGAAPMAYALWRRHLKHNPRDPKWPDRDRFVLSGGHGSMLLYSLLHLAGYDLPLDELKNFRQWGSKTPGHPEHGLTPGVETTTGPLGQGFATAVGMAMAEAHLAAVYNTGGHKVVDHFTYVLASDGDMMEGVACEAASLAGHLGLGKLICLYDSNDITLDGRASVSFSENVGARFESCGWHVLTVEDGNDVDAIDAALQAAKAETAKPSLLVIKTIIGFGSPNKADSAKAHGNPLGKDEVAATRQNLGWPDEAFHIPAEALEEFRRAVEDGQRAQAEWQSRFDAWAGQNAELARQWENAFSNILPDGWDAGLPTFGPEEAIATRASAGKALNAIAAKVPTLFGGSADLNSSTETVIKGGGDFENPALAENASDEGSTGGGWSYAGRNIHFGVREHAMGAAANGIALHGGLRPYTATFFNFLDYMKPAVRLAALMELPVTFVFTHDSVGLGEDGPTHQPIEQLAALRATPHVTTIRPADSNESVVAWQVAMENLHGPTALVLTRQKLPTLDRTKVAAADGLRKGAYVLRDAEGGAPEVILIGSGSEVPLVNDAADLLAVQGVRARVVSMPSWELFDAQDASYRDSVLTPGVKRVAVEAGAPTGWHKYAGSDGAVIALDHFGASAPYETVYKEFGLTPDNIANQALLLLGRAPTASADDSVPAEGQTAPSEGHS